MPRPLTQPLEDDLRAAQNASVSEIKQRIAETGFRCQDCGECCTRDVEVVAFPDEIQRIMGETGLDWLDVAGPNPVGDVDSRGTFHTFEWVLRRKPDGRCIFYEDGCGIYDSRPLLCRTYPFYVEDGEVRASECPGVGEKKGCPGGLASDLKRRWTWETREAIDLLRRFDAYCIAQRGVSLSRHPHVVVHDSRGSHRLSWSGDGYVLQD